MKQSKTPQHDRGSIAALAAIALVPLVIGLAIVVDSGRVWAERVALQNAVEATTAAAASTWVRTGSVCPPSVLDTLIADDATPVSHSCSTTGTSRDGTITVQAQQPTPLFFSSVLGRSNVDIEASTTARIGTASSLVNVWPIALCETHPALLEWRDSGFSLTTAYTISMQGSPNTCGPEVSGNWGVLDFDGGNNSTGDTIRWVQNGYPEPLDVGDEVFGSPGALTNSIGINSMIGKSVLIALFDLARLSGNNATYRISGFTRGVLLSTRLSGAAASRSLTFRFETAIVDRPSASVGVGGNFGITTWAICAYDNTGGC
jgi:hypothetical protein